MAEVVQILVRADGGREVVRTFEDIGRASAGGAQQLGGLVGGIKDVFSWLTTLRGLIVSVIAAETIGRVIEYSDAYSNLIGKLKLVSNSQAELIATEQAVFDVAQRTRQSLDATGQLYTRLAQTAGRYGVEQKDVLPIIETFNKSLLLSGANAQESGAAIRQFAQALGSGKLAGDELRSISENASVFFTKLNKFVPEANGNLRKFAAEGNLTAKIVARATMEMKKEVDAAFGKLPITIGQALTMVNNAAMRFFGQMSLFSGTGNAISEVLRSIANNFETIAKSAGVAAASVATFLAASAVGSVVGMFASIGRSAADATGRIAMMAKTGSDIGPIFQKAGTAVSAFGGVTAALQAAVVGLWATMRAHPFLTIITIVGTLTALIYAFGDSLKIPGTNITVLQAVAAAWDVLKQYMQAAWITAKGLYDEFRKSATFYPIVAAGLTALATVIAASLTSSIIAAVLAVGRFANALFVLTAATLTNPWVLLAIAIAGVVLVIAQLTGNLEPAKAALSSAADTIAQKFNVALGQSKTSLDQNKLAAAGVGAELTQLEKVQAQIEERTKAQVAAQTKLNAIWKEERDHINAVRGEQQKLNDMWAEANGGVKALTSSWKIYSNDRKGQMERELDDVRDLTARYRELATQSMKLVEDAAKKERDALEEATRAAQALYPALYAASNVSFSGTVSGLQGVSSAASNAATAMKATQSAYESLNQASTMDSLTNIKGSFDFFVGPDSTPAAAALKKNYAMLKHQMELATMQNEIDGTAIPKGLAEQLKSMEIELKRLDVARAKYFSGSGGSGMPTSEFSGIYRFARGGGFTVGGNNGTDNVSLANVHVSPGEQVNVKTRAQQRREEKASAPDVARPIIINMPITTADAGSFGRSETQIKQQLARGLAEATQRLGV